MTKLYPHSYPQALIVAPMTNEPIELPRAPDPSINPVTVDVA